MLCKRPNTADYVGFYLSDIFQSVVKSEMTARKNSSQLGMGGLMLGSLFYGLFGAMKTSINQNLCNPLPSFFEQAPQKAKPPTAKKIEAPNYLIRNMSTVMQPKPDSIFSY